MNVGATIQFLADGFAEVGECREGMTGRLSEPRLSLPWLSLSSLTGKQLGRPLPEGRRRDSRGAQVCGPGAGRRPVSASRYLAQGQGNR